MTTPSNRSLVVDVIADALSSEPDEDDYVEARSVARYLARAGLPQAALEGVLAGTHVVVPREPTKAMLATAEPAIDDYYNGTKDAPFDGGVAAVWHAMLAAAPPSPSDAKDESR